MLKNNRLNLQWNLNICDFYTLSYKESSTQQKNCWYRWTYRTAGAVGQMFYDIRGISQV